MSRPGCDVMPHPSSQFGNYIISDGGECVKHLGRAASRSSDVEELQGFLRRGTVVSERVGDVAPVVPADESEEPVLQGSKGLEGLAYAHLAAILLLGSVAHVVATVLDGPVFAPEGLQSRCAWSTMPRDRSRRWCALASSRCQCKPRGGPRRSLVRRVRRGARLGVRKARAMGPLELVAGGAGHSRSG